MTTTARGKALRASPFAPYEFDHKKRKEVTEQGKTYTYPQSTITASASTPGSRFKRRGGSVLLRRGHALATRWKVSLPLEAPADPGNAAQIIATMATQGGTKAAQAVAEALAAVQKTAARRLDLLPAFNALSTFADTLPEEERRALREDVAVLTQEWDHYLRIEGRTKTLPGLMSSLALGSSGQASKEGVALLTVHSAKGLEFDVVFILGMAAGVFPDYRARTPKELQEERRNAFVAVTRSKRLLYLAYPKKRLMPWGDVKYSAPSSFILNTHRQ